MDWIYWGWDWERLSFLGKVIGLIEFSGDGRGKVKICWDGIGKVRI